RSAPTLKVTVRPFYSVAPPAGELPTVELQLGEQPPSRLKFDKFPLTVELPWPNFTTDADLPLRLLLKVNDKSVVLNSQLISRVDRLTARVEALKVPALIMPTLESATLPDRRELLLDLAAGNDAETDFPAAELLNQAETLSDGTWRFGPEHAGMFWLSTPVGKKRQPCRIWVPKNLKPETPVPLVVALHGAGGSENMFFETYGHGQIVRECQKRGWMLVTTRSGLNFGGAPPIADVITQLSARYPIDRGRLFIVGHSMGAGQTIAAVQAHRTLFAGAAALGGGGRVTAPEVFEKTPLFVGVGTKDFALAGARSLARNAPMASLKEYTDVEHLVIVREALPDVFSAWEKLPPRPPAK
ncbi:MAG: hypothetical protein ACRCZF_21405, partial [Gemmataceae bacterium]